MKSLKELVRTYRYELLIGLCINYGFVEIPIPNPPKVTYPNTNTSYYRNYYANIEKSFKNRQDILNLILRYFNDYNFFNSLLPKIKDSHSTALFLKVLMDNDGEISLNKLIQTLQPFYSVSTIKKTYQILYCRDDRLQCANIVFKDTPMPYGVCLYFEPMIYLPEEYRKFTEWFIKRHIKGNKSYKIDKEDRISPNVETIEELVLINKDHMNLRDSSKRLGFPVSGSREVIFNKLFTQTSIPHSQVLSAIFLDGDLKLICTFFNLKSSGKKIDLATRILNKVPIWRTGSKIKLKLRPDRMGW